MKTMKKLFTMLTVLCMLLPGLVLPAFATSEEDASALSSNKVFYFTEVKGCYDNTGYTNGTTLGALDPLMGVKMFELAIRNFSETTIYDGKRVFLKTDPDIPELSITLLADPDNIGGTGASLTSDSAVSVPDYAYRGPISRGLLLIEHTEYSGRKNLYSIPDFCDVLQEEESPDQIPVLLAEEGYYRISILWEVRKYSHTVKDWKNPFYYKKLDIYNYYNYRQDASFIVANGNTMAYIFDQATGNELSNGSVCRDGFRLDLANSQFLKVQIKREVLLNGSSALAETDVRFNTVASTQRVYDAQGLYTVEASNQFTGASTVKRILVADPNSPLATAAAKAYPEDFSTLSVNGTENNKSDVGESPSFQKKPAELAAETQTNPSYGPLLYMLAVFLMALVLMAAATVCIVLVKKVH